MKPTRGIVGQPASEPLAGLPEGADAPMATDPLHREVVPSVATSDGALTYEFVPSQGDRGVLVESLPVHVQGRGVRVPRRRSRGAAEG
jgi:hypothetical protein